MRRPAFIFLLLAQWSVVSHAAADTAVPVVEDNREPALLESLWQEQRAAGLWRNNYFHSSKGLDDKAGFIGSTLELKLLPQFGDTISGKLEWRATNAALNEDADAESRLLEGYALIHFASADLYLGKQIVAWGRADGINPTDNLTPRDYTVMLPFEDDQRFGTPAVRLDTFLSQAYTLTAFATPLFEPSKVPLPTAEYRVLEREPAHTLSNTAGGLRLNKVGAGLDWSLSWFRGFSLLPGMRALETALGPVLELQYDRITVYGWDFARNYGRFGFRGEAAYVDTTDDAGMDASVKNPYLHWIAGVDRTFFANLNINLQFFQRRIRNHRDIQIISSPLERNIALQNALIGGQRDRISSGVTFRVSNKWLNDTLEAEVFAVANIRRDDGLLRPLVTYAFSDTWKGTLGAEIYRGAADTEFGSLKSNRGAFAELRYGF
jgi:hypothetical protein